MRLQSGVVLVLWLAAAGIASGATPPALVHVKLLEIETTLAADGSAVAVIHAENQADNAAAVMAVGQTSVPYVTGYQTLDIVEAYTRKADGRKIPVDVGAIYDQLPSSAPGIPMITDMHMKTIVFPQFTVGDTAVYTARVTTMHPVFPGQFEGAGLFPKQAAFDDVEETLTAPASLALYVENHDVQFEKSHNGGRAIYRWHYSAPASATAELPSISPFAHLPHFFVSTFPDYAALGRAYATAAAPASAVTPTIKALADSIAKDARDQRAIARALYEWVGAHVRYVAVELGKGSMIPHTADAVLANGYGDCKDHVALLAALLKAEGIASEAVLLNGTTDYALSDVPTFAGLDHVITYVPGLDLYLDSTSGLAPFGVLPFTEYGKPAIFASGTAPRLGAIPVLPAGLASMETKTVSHLDKSGVLTGTTTVTAKGPYAVALHFLALKVQAVGGEAAAKRLLEFLGYGNDATGTLETVPTALADSYSMSATFTANGWSDRLAGTQSFLLPGGMRLLGLSGEGLMGPLPPNSGNDDSEIPCHSGQATEDLSLEAPAGEHFANVPPDIHVQTANILFDAHWTLNGQTLSVHRSFMSTIDRPLCTAAIRTANADALKKIADSYEVQLSFDVPGRSGKQAWYANDIANPPKDPKLAAALTNALAAMQNHEDGAAIAQFSAILAEPDLPISASYPARYNRSILYARNWRYDEALTDLDAALKVTPRDTRMLLTRALVYFERADFAHALADCDTELAGDPTNPLVLRLRANIAMETGNYQNAIRDYTTEIRITPDPTVLVLRAVAYHRIGRESAAAADIATAGRQGDARAKPAYDAITGAINPNVGAAFATKHSAAVVDSTPSQESDSSGVAAANEHAVYYPALSAMLGEIGIAKLKFTIRPDGSVGNPTIEKSSGFPSLDSAALESVKAWRYKPARLNGRSIARPWSAAVKWKF
ncbi:MAG: TonB family protein [Rhizomicrobium sp.]